ncbi:MAG TPA: serine hydrolase domain-containing protein [Rugosimonospora sp.]|nr:serine hydrolase domain-containing protein [Rugosimonospora sp.]
MLLPETIRRVDETVASAQATGRVPSLVAAVVRDGAVAHFTGVGELPAPDPDTQYRIGSISKTFTAALVLGLRDEGRLSLDDPLERYLPGTPAAAVTLRQLLAHVAGLQREPDGDWWERAPGADLDGLLAGLHAEKLAWPPLRSYHYSNLAYGLLGAVVERTGGADWSTLVTKRLLQPLGMARTTYHASEPFARGYVVHPWHGTLREEPRHDAGAMAPAGQLWSTTTDLAKWAAFLVDPEPPLLSAPALAQMCAPVVISDPEAWTAGHGLGVQVWRRGERVYAGHGGSMPGYLAILVVHRRSRTGVVAFANAYSLRGIGIGALGLNLLDLVLDLEPQPAVPPVPWRPGAAPPPEVEPLTGRWWWMGREYEAAWDEAGRELVISSVLSPTAVPWRMQPRGTDVWQCVSGENDGELMHVHRGRGGAPTTLDIATFIFTRDPWPAL